LINRNSARKHIKLNLLQARKTER